MNNKQVFWDFRPISALNRLLQWKSSGIKDYEFAGLAI
jgi:hypothetical protein